MQTGSVTFTDPPPPLISARFIVAKDNKSFHDITLTKYILPELTKRH